MRSTTWVDSFLAYKFEVRSETIIKEEHSSLLLPGPNVDEKKSLIMISTIPTSSSRKLTDPSNRDVETKASNIYFL